MRISVGSVAPTLVVLAILGWLLQYYLEPPEALNIPKLATLEVADSLLSPALDPLPGRNPFRLVGDVDEPTSPALATASPAVKSQITPPSSTAKGPSTPASQAERRQVAPASKPLEGLADRLRRLVDSLKSRAEQARLIQADLRTKVDGKVKLSATSIHGDRRIAILNGRTYAEGEAIDWATGLSGPILVGEVRPASVILRSGRARVEVSFPSASTATGPPPTVAVAKPVSKRSANTRKAAGTGSGRPR